MDSYKINQQKNAVSSISNGKFGIVSSPVLLGENYQGHNCFCVISVVVGLSRRLQQGGGGKQRQQHCLPHAAEKVDLSGNLLKCKYRIRQLQWLFFNFLSLALACCHAPLKSALLNVTKNKKNNLRHAMSNWLCVSSSLTEFVSIKKGGTPYIFTLEC